jgi:hypothetical protein
LARASNRNFEACENYTCFYVLNLGNENKRRRRKEKNFTFITIEEKKLQEFHNNKTDEFN